MVETEKPKPDTNLSLDDIFIENKFATKWQILMLFLSCVSLFHSGMFVISPSFFRTKQPFVCADEKYSSNCDQSNSTNCEQVSYFLNSSVESNPAMIIF